MGGEVGLWKGELIELEDRFVHVFALHVATDYLSLNPSPRLLYPGFNLRHILAETDTLAMTKPEFYLNRFAGDLFDASGTAPSLGPLLASNLPLLSSPISKPAPLFLSS